MREPCEHQETLAFDPASIIYRLGQEGVYRLTELSRDIREADLSSLLQQLSMHLPRLSVSGNYCQYAVLNEAERLAYRLQALRRGCNLPMFLVAKSSLTLDCLRAEPIKSSIASAIFRNYHYLLSDRADGFSIGLKCSQSDWPVALACLSEFDLNNIAEATSVFTKPECVRVLSRVYAFASAPRNSISFLLSEVRRFLRDNLRDVRLLVTYLNPNIGFSGASYRADNWTLLGQEVDVTYVYLDGNYRTDRSLAAEFGTAQIPELRQQLGTRIDISRVPLLPLALFVRPVTATQHQLKSRYLFRRWSPSKPHWARSSQTGRDRRTPHTGNERLGDF